MFDCATIISWVRCDGALMTKLRWLATFLVSSGSNIVACNFARFAANDIKGQHDRLLRETGPVARKNNSNWTVKLVGTKPSSCLTQLIIVARSMEIFVISFSILTRISTTFSFPSWEAACKGVEFSLSVALALAFPSLSKTCKKNNFIWRYQRCKKKSNLRNLFFRISLTDWKRSQISLLAPIFLSQ